MEQITRVIQAIEEGDAGASDRLLPLVYEELRSLAARKLAHEPPGQTLQATALVHEAYLRLIGSEGNGDSAGKNLGWDSRTHFFAAAAEAMRRILIDNARRKQALCHGGGRERIELDDQFIPAQESSDAADMIALSDALERFAAEDPLKAELVKLRYFAGLSLEEAGAMLKLSRATAYRYWLYARAWLHDAIVSGSGSQTAPIERGR